MAKTVRVVVNAWGRVGSAGEAFDADDALIRAIDELVDSGVVVLFSASNHGPGPSTLSLEAEDPRVITPFGQLAGVTVRRARVRRLADCAHCDTSCSCSGIARCDCVSHR